MLDFLLIAKRTGKNGVTEIYPRFKLYPKSSDLMVRGRDFYAIWIEERGLWSTDEQDALQLIDMELDKYAKENKDKLEGKPRILHMWDSESGMIDNWHKYCQKQMRDSFHMLDEKIIFSNAETKKEDYASKRLSYPLEQGKCPAYDKIMSTLYSPEERHKIEWAVGSVVTGDSKNIQKFMVLYGAAGTGKSTVLNIIQQLFEGYYSVFDAKALGSSNNSFALEAFKSNPLVAIQHDGDLSRIEDNTRLNSLVSHELMTVNEKFKSTYESNFKCFLFMGTNKPVKITDGKSGLIRRLIDVSPSGNKLNAKDYKTATKQIKFELGAIANHCQEVYLSNPGAYDNYIPIAMLGASNDFYNFVIDSYSVFLKEDGTTLKAAWEMYKTYCEEAKVSYPFSQRNFKEELKNYFRDFNERFSGDDGSRLRSYYSGFRTEKFDDGEKNVEEDEDRTKSNHIVFGDGPSIFDQEYSEYPAQYATEGGTPSRKWEKVRTKLSNIDTSKLHYVKVPENHIVIDFDIKDKDGKKSFEKNIEAASKWPATYAELSKSEAGMHLHYIYSGDATKLSRIYDDNIEVKVFTGNSSLRRKLTKCNDLPIATISSGLPLKGDDKVINWDGIKNEKMLRTMIKRNLNKEYHPATKPSVDYINKLLEDAYQEGLKYDVSDMKNAVLAFAASSTNQADYCIKLVTNMKFKSDEPSVNTEDHDADLVFFDCEVFPNLFLVNWKVAGEGKPIVRMVNPKPKDIEELVRFKLVGFNCRRYDNHMLYACMLGYTNEQLYNLSMRIVNSKKGTRGVLFGEAYNMSYTDIYDFAAKKQSLKKWEIELGLHHQECEYKWDEPVPEDKWSDVAAYCDNDVISTEALFNHLQGDFTARKILANLAGMTVNDTTNSLTTRIIFGKEKKPNLVYTDLATGEQSDGAKDLTSNTKYPNAFPGYEYKDGKNIYRGTDLGFGGYVYAEPGMYWNVALLDVASLHPHSVLAMNCFGAFTKNFEDILNARIAIKHKDFDAAKTMLNGRLAPYLDDASQAKDLAKALKIAINSVYGLTSANFDNPFRDIRNKNNIVALRGALFMRTLQDEVVERGYTVAHIKTDSIKIPNATPEIIKFCLDFANQYGYQFEHEGTYERMCLVNNAVYIAKFASAEDCQKQYGYIPEDNQEDGGKWTATGAQFQIPYVFKKLFSKESIEFPDMCETKEVKTALYLDMNEKLPEGEHDHHFIGRVGLFCPIKPGCGGGDLVREGTDKEGNAKYDSATGAKGYRWLEAEMVKILEKEDAIDVSYYNKLVDDAVDTISQYGDFEQFVADDIPEGSSPWQRADNPNELPWYVACGKETCANCRNLIDNGDYFTCKKGFDISDFSEVNRDAEDLFSKR